MCDCGKAPFCIHKLDDVVRVSNLTDLGTDVNIIIPLGTPVPSIKVHEVGNDVQRPRAANHEHDVTDELSGCIVTLRPPRVDGRPMLRFRSLSGSAASPSYGAGERVRPAEFARMRGVGRKHRQPLLNRRVLFRVVHVPISDHGRDHFVAGCSVVLEVGEPCW